MKLCSLVLETSRQPGVHPRLFCPIDRRISWEQVAGTVLVAPRPRTSSLVLESRGSAASKISGCPGRERAQTPFVQLEISFWAALPTVKWPRRSYFKRDSWKATWTQRLRLGVPRAKPAEPVDVHTTPGSQAASTCIPTYQSTSFRHYTISFSSRAFSFSSIHSARGLVVFGRGQGKMESKGDGRSNESLQLRHGDSGISRCRPARGK